jgi:hypothetical protein
VRAQSSVSSAAAWRITSSCIAIALSLVSYCSVDERRG